jgi:hypothetical protein
MAGQRMRTERLSCDSRGLVLFTYTENYKPGTHGESYSNGDAVIFVLALRTTKIK